MDIIKNSNDVKTEFYKQIKKRNIIVTIFFAASFLLPLTMILLLNYGIPELYKKKIIAIQVEGTPSYKNVYYIDSPIVNSNNVKTWLKEALNKSFSYNSVNYAQHKNKISSYYTNLGLTRFMLDFQNKVDKNFKSGIEIVDSIIIESPVLLKTKIFNYDKRAWQFYAKIDVFYKGQFGNGYYSYDAIITVNETDPKEYKQGIAIDDIKIK